MNLPDLWPEGIEHIDRLDPFKVLEAQADYLSAKTEGVAVGVFGVKTGCYPADEAADLVIYAPSLNYFHKVVDVLRAKGAIYPAFVYVGGFSSSPIRCDTYVEFQRVIRGRLDSDEIRSVLENIWLKTRPTFPIDLGKCPIVVTDAESARKAAEWVENSAKQAILSKKD